MRKWLRIMLLSAIMAGCAGLASCQIGSSGGSQQPPVESVGSVTLNHARIKLERGETYALMATKTDLESDVVWYSYNQSVVSVNENGEMTAWSSGKTTVLAIVGDKSASCEVLVVEPAVEKNDYVLSISSSEVRLNAAKSETTELTAVVTHNGETTQAVVNWSIVGDAEILLQADETDVCKAVVSATENDKNAVVTVTAVVDGVTLNAYCDVYSGVFTNLTFKNENISLLVGDTYDVQENVEVRKDGNLVNDPKLTYFSENSGIASVDENGLITANRTGETAITVSYGRENVTIPVTVGAIEYVSTAAQFLAMDGADANTKFVLTNHIDLSAYFKENPAINQTCLIEQFNASLDGQGYSVSGWYRLATGDDTTFKGIFANVNDGARIENVHFKAYINSKNPVPVISETNMGDITNCIFEIQGVDGFARDGAALFKMSNGAVHDTLFIVDGTWDDNSLFAMSNGGYGTFDNCAVIAPTLTESAYINKSNNVVNPNVNKCFYYENVQAFIAKTAYTVSITGKTEEYSFGSKSNYNADVFYVESGKIYLKNETETKPFEYASFAVQEKQALTSGESWTLPMPSADGVVSISILDNRNRIITDDVVIDGTFTATAQGEYKLLYYVETSGVYASALTVITVSLEEPVINTYSVVLNAEETYGILVEKADTDVYYYYSQDEKVATVSENGVVTAIAAGETYISVVSSDGVYAYTVKVEVLPKENEYIEVGDKQALLAALRNSTNDTYVVLTADVAFDMTDMIKGGNTSDTDATPAASYRGQHPVSNEWYDFNCYYRYLVREFNGTFDAQGHKITVTYEGDVEDIMCGMFLTLNKTAVVKNLYYVFNGEYTPTGAVSFTSTFVRTCYGVVSSSYFEMNCNKTVAYSDAEGVIGYLQDKGGSVEIDVNSANCYNCLFNVRMTVDGKVQEGGYAFRVGISEPHAYDSVLIRNGVATDFYGDFNNGASGVSCSGVYHYRTAYDFVNAISGNSYSLQRVSTPIPDGQKAYANWGGEWEIDKNGVYFFGRKILNTAFESYNQPLELPVNENYGTLSWSLSGVTDIYINGGFVKSTTDKKFAISEYLFAKYGERSGKYNVLIKGEKQSAVIVYEMIALGQNNFFNTVNGIDSKEAAKFKYFFLTENVNLTSVSAENTYLGGVCMFSAIYNDLDGRGHSLIWKYARETGNYHGFAAVFANVTWKNVALKGSATLGAAATLTGVFAYETSSCTFENCYIEINVNSKIAKDIPMIYSIRGGTTFRNCVVVLTDTNQTDGYIVTLAGKESHSSFYRNSVFVCDVPTETLFGERDNFMTVSGSFQYNAIDDFIEGNSGLSIALDNHKYTIMGVSDKIYLNLLDNWTISDKEIVLNGEVVRRFVKIGDNNVLDSEIS